MKDKTREKGQRASSLLVLESVHETMPIPPESKREQSSTYFIQDRANQDELKRLQVQDHLYTAGMGGVLPEQPNPTGILRVLDVGCGTGSWLIELARTIPTCRVLIGVDASHTFVEYARAQAKAAQVSDRVEFHVADALRMLEFPTRSFDLVNHRLASSWLRTWDWRKLLQEYQRVCRPGGVVRITEYEGIVVSTSPALWRLNELTLQALYQSGHYFTPTNEGMTEELARLLHQHGLQEVHTRISPLKYHAGTPECQSFFENMKLFFWTILPFLRKWTQVPENYEEIYQQMLGEMQQPDFAATWALLTAWGTVPAQTRE
jgi:ubiquinone/menaquinone biosynthesis C-methylase UbiE